MSVQQMLRHEFVDVIPAHLHQGTLYVCIPYATAVHQCCCGCGTEVVTPLSPTDWKLTFDGATVSLDPSIGNWSFACGSHYWITRSQVRWARNWTQDEVAEGRRLDRDAKERFYADPAAYGSRKQNDCSSGTSPDMPTTSFWRRLLRWWKK